MRKIIIVDLITLIILIQISIVTYASNAKIELISDNKTNEVNRSASLRITNNVPIGALEGVLSYQNVEDVKLNSDKNGWALTYNETTGLFNIIKPTGATDEIALEITYKVKSSKDNSNITISNIKAVTIDYNTITDIDDLVIEEKNDNSTAKNEQQNDNKIWIFVVAFVLILGSALMFIVYKKQKNV